MKNIVLTGMMGAGKTTAGKMLSDILPDFVFIDMDSKIEKELGVSISEIFKEHGEAYFRDLETKFLEKYSTINNLIISTGGGIVERSENIDLIKKNGIMFYLSAPAEELFERIKHTTNRPLLANPNPCDKIKELLSRRAKNYKKADFEIITTNKTIQEIAQEIVKKYKNYGK